VETNVSDYALTAILSMITDNKKVHPVAFYSHIFSAPELNYNIHDKKLLVIFKTFWIWQYYLEGSALLIDIVIDHKNLEYFSTTKILIYWQVRWSEYFFQFNLVIQFCPGQFSTKLDTLIRQYNVYPKEEDNGYTSVNSYNFC